MWVRITLNAIRLGTLNGCILVRYFLWDTFDAIINFIDAGFVAHGIACFSIFFLSYVRVSHNRSPFRNPHSFFFLPETIYVILRYSCASLGSKYLFLEYPLVRTLVFLNVCLIMSSGFWIKRIKLEANFS
jgi:hypothetical protein